ncbi:hypothetical protein SAMN05428975_0316 [Mucilaginibacter sp. OK268]|uniref:hypothetical protein n=1 Tax=Mucilaginibacter sp. OK268 TaxID=1881048 RepID=UPI00087F1FA5|nr:hypothetical protein [Mucilaginibacter sp. OK268]SDP10390.1 hypothetical protein SAMN05428975_0316 [Mucilaginibacter sp. OK268]
MNPRNYETIPLPPFAFADVVNRKAKQFSDHRLRGPLFTVHDLGDKVQSELWGLNSDGDRIQFLGYLVNHVVEKIEEHEKTCHEAHCRVRLDGEVFLYFLYGKLEENGLKIAGDLFTSTEIVENDQTIREIGFKLDELKNGDHIIYDDIQMLHEIMIALKTDIAELKNLYVLGKKKWYQQVYGIVFENLANKGMDELMKELAPLLSRLGHEIVIKYLQG